MSKLHDDLVAEAQKQTPQPTKPGDLGIVANLTELDGWVPLSTMAWIEVGE